MGDFYLISLHRSDDEVDDEHIHKLMIVTQTPPGPRTKAATSDRTSSFMTRAKMTTDIAQAINDGLYFYEQVCSMQ